MIRPHAQPRPDRSSGMTIGFGLWCNAPETSALPPTWVSRSTTRGWLGAMPRAVASLDGAHLTELELRQEIVKLRRRVDRLAALLRLALALLHVSGFRLAEARLPDRPATAQDRDQQLERAHARVYANARAPLLGHYGIAPARAIPHAVPN